MGLLRSLRGLSYQGEMYSTKSCPVYVEDEVTTRWVTEKRRSEWWNIQSSYLFSRVWFSFGLLGFNASATARVISRR